MRLVAIVGFLLLLLVPARAQALAQPATVSRPGGQLVVALVGTTLVVTDTRSDDPGWSVSGVDSVARVTAPFPDGSGTTYAQHVALLDGVAVAPAHHGLGIATLVAHTGAQTVTITVI